MDDYEDYGYGLPEDRWLLESLKRLLAALLLVLCVVAVMDRYGAFKSEPAPLPPKTTLRVVPGNRPSIVTMRGGYGVERQPYCFGCLRDASN